MCGARESVVSRSFPAAGYGADPGTAAEGRGYVRRCLWELCTPAELTETAVLLTSELLTNAVLHGSTPVSVQVQVRGDRVRVSVADASPATPVMRAGDATGGWGLNMLDRAASDWGHHEQDTGKCVWFELALPQRPCSPDRR